MIEQSNNRRWTLPLAGLLLLVAACNEIIDNSPPDFQNLKESRPIGNAKALDVRLRYDIGKLEVRSDGSGDLFSFNLDYDARKSKPRFDFKMNGDRAVMELEMDHRFGIGNSNKRANELSLRLNDSIPLDLDFSAGVSDSHLDLTGLDITRFHLRGGVGRTEVSFDRPQEKPMAYFEVESGVGNLTIRGLGNARVEHLKVDGGVGRTDLDFTGEAKDARMDTEINVGVGQVRLLVPRSADITIEAESSFLSNLSAPGFEKNGSTYTRRSTDDDSTKIFIRIRSGVGGVTVELI